MKRQEKELVYAGDIVLVVFRTMGCRETREKLEETFRGCWCIQVPGGEGWRQDDGLQVGKRQVYCILEVESAGLGDRERL